MEANYINSSLSALGDVMAALANKQKHVPFRNSKLTQLLADSLSGQAKVGNFRCVSHLLILRPSLACTGI